MKDNCFNTIRLLAALQVALANHGPWHLQVSAFPEPFLSFLNFFNGVPIFFTLSGYLIWMSVGRSKSFGQFCKKRFLRLYPELWVAVAVEILAIVLLFVGEIDWPKLALFAAGQATIFPFWVPDFLRSYGCGTPNGALWSIFALVQFYVLAYPMYQLLHKKGWIRWSGVMIFWVLLSIVFHYFHTLLPVNLSKIGGISFVPYFWLFMLGALASEYQDKVLPIVVKYWYVFVLLGIMILYVHLPSLPVHNYSFSHTTILFFAILAIGYRWSKLNIKTDISYGIYIYHMTVINALIALDLRGGGCGKLITVAAVTIWISYLSTKTIGSYSNLLKSERKM